MELRFNREQVFALQKKLEEDKELASLLPISDEITKIYEKRKQQYLNSLSCDHEWPTDVHGHIYGPTACKHCGLQYHARNKERSLEIFEENFDVIIELH